MVGFCAWRRMPAGLTAQRVPRQVIQANRPWTGSRPQSAARGIFGNCSGFSAMWTFAG